MRILIINHSFTGHNLHYCSLLCRNAVRLGQTPVLATPLGTTSSVEFSKYAEYGHFNGTEFHEEGTDATNTGMIDTVARSIRMLSTAHEQVRRLRCDWVWMHSADQITDAAALPFAPKFMVPVEALHLRGGYAHPLTGMIKRARHRFSRRATLRSPWLTSWHLDPVAYSALHVESARIQLMPEPVEHPLAVSQEDARALLNLPVSSRILMILGAIDSRKGVIQLMDAYRKARPRDITLVLMGLLYPDVKETVLQLANEMGPGSCVVRDQMLSPEHFQLALAACDWQALTYQGHYGSSGILVRAAAHQRPVLATSLGWIGQATTRYGLGITCDASSVQSIAMGINQLGTLPQCGGSEAKRFVDFNTEANFNAHWANQVIKRMGIQTNPTYLEWK
jgi:hypothetical protein